MADEDVASPLRASLHEKHAAVDAARAALASERAALTAELAALAVERAAMQREHEARCASLDKELAALASERAALTAERAALAVERAAMQREHEARCASLDKELAVADAEQAAWAAERDALALERTALRRANESAAAFKAALSLRFKRAREEAAVAAPRPQVGSAAQPKALTPTPVTRAALPAACTDAQSREADAAVAPETASASKRPRRGPEPCSESVTEVIGTGAAGASAGASAGAPQAVESPVGNSGPAEADSDTALAGPTEEDDLSVASDRAAATPAAPAGRSPSAVPSAGAAAGPSSATAAGVPGTGNGARRGAKPPLGSYVGRLAWIYWPKMKSYYSATVLSYDATSNEYEVKYDCDGTFMMVDFDDYLRMKPKPWAEWRKPGSAVPVGPKAKPVPKPVSKPARAAGAPGGGALEGGSGPKRPRPATAARALGVTGAGSGGGARASGRSMAAGLISQAGARPGEGRPQPGAAKRPKVGAGAVGGSKQGQAGGGTRPAAPQPCKPRPASAAAAAASPKPAAKSAAKPAAKVCAKPRSDRGAGKASTAKPKAPPPAVVCIGGGTHVFTKSTPAAVAVNILLVSVKAGALQLTAGAFAALFPGCMERLKTAMRDGGRTATIKLDVVGEIVDACGREEPFSVGLTVNQSHYHLTGPWPAAFAAAGLQPGDAASFVRRSATPGALRLFTFRPKPGASVEATLKAACGLALAGTPQESLLLMQMGLEGMKPPEAVDEDVCAECGSDGRLYMCDGDCRRSWHWACCPVPVPTDDDALLFCSDCRPRGAAGPGGGAAAAGGPTDAGASGSAAAETGAGAGAAATAAGAAAAAAPLPAAADPLDIRGLKCWERGKVFYEDNPARSAFRYVTSMARGDKSCTCGGITRKQAEAGGSYARVICAVHGGSQYRLRVGRAGVAPPEKGEGLVSLERIPRGAYVAEYTGEHRSVAEADDIQERRRHRAELHHEAFVNYEQAASKTLVVDAALEGSALRFVNHSCAPSLGCMSVADGSRRLRVVYFANRDIAPGEELTSDYFFSERGEQGAHGGGPRRRQCLCGVRKCRKLLAGF